MVDTAEARVMLIVTTGCTRKSYVCYILSRDVAGVTAKGTGR